MKGLKYALSVLAVLAAAGLLTWALWPSDAPAARRRTAGSASKGLIPDAAKNRPQPIEPAQAVTAPKETTEVANVVDVQTSETVRIVSEEGYYTNKDGKVCLYKADKSAYTNGVEQLLNMVIPSSPGAEVPPLPIISEDDAKELERALKHKIGISKDDDEAAIERKMLITQGKLEMDEQRQAGGMNVSEYVNALRDQYNDNAAFLAEARKLDQQIYEDPAMTDGDYAKAREQINAKLKERGLPELEERE